MDRPAVFGAFDDLGRSVSSQVNLALRRTRGLGRCADSRGVSRSRGCRRPSGGIGRGLIAHPASAASRIDLSRLAYEICVSGYLSPLSRRLCDPVRTGLPCQGPLFFRVGTLRPCRMLKVDKDCFLTSMASAFHPIGHRPLLHCCSYRYFPSLAPTFDPCDPLANGLASA